MASRRMMSLAILDSDEYLDLPFSAQQLYVQLCVRADDDGFVGAPRRIQRLIGARESDLSLLIEKRYLLAFDSGIVAIRHWKTHNCIRRNRYHPTIYQDEFANVRDSSEGIYAIRTAAEQSERGAARKPAPASGRHDKFALTCGKACPCQQ